MEKIQAYVLVNTEIGQEHLVANQIIQLTPEVLKVVVTYGQYDLVVEIEADSLRRLDEIITAIRRIPGVKSTVTLIGS